MKKTLPTILIVVVCILVIALLGRGEKSNTHEGEAKTPYSSNDQKGKNYQDVIEAFKSEGFTNVKIEEVDDLITGWIVKEGDVESVLVDGYKDYKVNAWYPNDAEVIVTYHVFPKNKDKPKSTDVILAEQTSSQPDDEDDGDELAKGALELVFPVENAKRAATVSIINRYSSDIFAEDGDTYDVSKFHSYSDTSGNLYDYYMKENSHGEWSVKDEATWHVERLILENLYGTVVDVSLDVSFDGFNYVVSNITGTFGQANNLNDVFIGKDDSICLTVPPELIKDDREATKADTHRKWVSDQFSSWDGSNTNLKKMIIKNLNDEKSFKHINTTYIEINSEEIKDMVNETLASANKKAMVEFGDLWITTDFSAKNQFNSTIKYTAYGIASFSNNSTVLVAIE